MNNLIMIRKAFPLSLWRSARGRLLLLVLLIVAPTLAIQVAGAWNDLQKEIQTRKIDAMGIMTHAQGDFKTLLAGTNAVFADLVRLNEMRRPDNCAQMFNALRLAYERLAPQVKNIGLSDAQGNIYCAVQPVLGKSSIAEEPFFQDAVKSLDTALGVYANDPLTGIPALNFAYPVLSFNGQIQTVVFVIYDTRWLELWLNEITLPNDTTLSLLGPDGNVLQEYRNGEVLQDDPDQNAAWLAPLLAGQEVVESRDEDGIRRLHALVPLAQDSHTAGYLELGYPVEELYAQANTALRWKLALLGLAFLAVLVLAWWGSELLFLHPLGNLMQVVNQLQAGDLHARTVAGYGLTELTQLSQAFNRMANALQQRETDRQQAQAHLQESEERFRAVLDNAAVGMAVMSLDRHITQINQRAMWLTGYSAEELFDLNPSLLAVEEDRYLDRELFLELIDGRRDQYTVEKRYIRKDGSIFWGRVNFSAVRGGDGRPLYTIGMIEDITEEKRGAEKLAAQEAEHRRALERRITERTEELNKANELLQQKAAQDAVTAERTRLARELHDAVTQTLFSATLIADVLPDLWEHNPIDGRRRLAELHQLTRGALAEMRALLVELRPNALIEVPLPTLLRQLAEAFTGRARINVQLSVDGQCQLSPDMQVALYRIVQEALNNIAKHSKATQAMITLRLGDSMRVTVADNGAGFDPSTVTADHLGLKIMRERAEAIGAKFSLYSEPGEGTQISVVW